VFISTCLSFEDVEVKCLIEFLDITCQVPEERIQNICYFRE
jgi:hypothetical protein